MSRALGTTPANEIASHKVVSVSPTAKLEEVARLFEEHDINMAPVVDGFDKCVGVITSKDVVGYEAVRDALSEQFRHGIAFDLAHYSDGTHKITGAPFDEVAFHMSKDIKTIGRTSPLSLAAKTMCLEHVHHLVLLDDAGRPDGILSSLDILSELIGEPISRAKDTPTPR